MQCLPYVEGSHTDFFELITDNAQSDIRIKKGAYLGKATDLSD